MLAPLTEYHLLNSSGNNQDTGIFDLLEFNLFSNRIYLQKPFLTSNYYPRVDFCVHSRVARNQHTGLAHARSTKCTVNFEKERFSFSLSLLFDRLGNKWR